MDSSSPQGQNVLGMLTDLGVEVDDLDAAVIAAAQQTFEPGIRMLLDTDLSGIEPEVDCDPSAPPP